MTFFANFLTIHVCSRIFTYDDYFLDTPKYLFPDPKLHFRAHFEPKIEIFHKEIKPCRIKTIETKCHTCTNSAGHQNLEINQNIENIEKLSIKNSPFSIQKVPNFDSF